MPQRQNIIAKCDDANAPTLKAQEFSRDESTWQHISEPVARIAKRGDKLGRQHRDGRKFQRHEYDEEQLALFAAYIPNRAYFRPQECRENIGRCWVRLGPPAFSTAGGNSRCIGCGGNVITGRQP